MTDAINDAVAMAIAVTKATLVILFFMGVWHSARINKVVVWSSFFFLMVLFAFSSSTTSAGGGSGCPGSSASRGFDGPGDSRRPGAAGPSVASDGC